MKSITFKSIQQQAITSADDIIACSSMEIAPRLNYPIHLDFTVVMICVEGSATVTIDFESYEVVAPAMITVVPNKRFEFKQVSDNYRAYYTFISLTFAQELLDSIDNKISMIMTLHSYPMTPLDGGDVATYTRFYESIKIALDMREHPYRTEIVKHLLLAFHYAFTISYQRNEQVFAAPQERIISDFLRLANQHYKSERMISFYATKLGRTPKYISKILREATGRSAKEWLDEMTMSEAKRLLKSTGQTILQISDELNFPSQSFFGKYFKSHMGISPSKYRGY